ncbi:MAG: hypothetical protein ABR551_13980 [Gemmatimonadales bacterium]
MTERRYTDQEAAEIFERAAAAEAERPRLAPGQGMTLADLQQIGGEAGIDPALVAHAAGALDQRPTTPFRRFLGLPIGVGHTVDLGRPITEAEWHALVGELRETFQATGLVREDGPFRQWTNGNLKVMVEPSGAGHRVRFQTYNGGARQMMTAGAVSMGLAGALLVSSMLVPGVAQSGIPAGVSMLAAMGVGFFGLGALRLPAWARRRREQMAALGARLLGRGSTTQHGE